MKLFSIITILPLLISCTGSHPISNNVDIDELKTLPDDAYHYRGDRLIVNKGDVMIWYNTDGNGNITNIWKIVDTKEKENTTAQAIEKYALDTVTEKAAAVHFTELSHRYHFGKIIVDHKTKITYSTDPDIVEEYIYPLNDSVLNIYQNQFGFEKLENGWFGRKD